VQAPYDESLSKVVAVLKTLLQKKEKSGSPKAFAGVVMQDLSLRDKHRVSFDTSSVIIHGGMNSSASLAQTILLSKGRPSQATPEPPEHWHISAPPLAVHSPLPRFALQHSAPELELQFFIVTALVHTVDWQ
jgi:hypothetical protein